MSQTHPFKLLLSSLLILWFLIVFNIQVILLSVAHFNKLFRLLDDFDSGLNSGLTCFGFHKNLPSLNQTFRAILKVISQYICYVINPELIPQKLIFAMQKKLLSIFRISTEFLKNANGSKFSKFNRFINRK